MATYSLKDLLTISSLVAHASTDFDATLRGICGDHAIRGARGLNANGQEFSLSSTKNSCKNFFRSYDTSLLCLRVHSLQVELWAFSSMKYWESNGTSTFSLISIPS